MGTEMGAGVVAMAVEAAAVVAVVGAAEAGTGSAGAVGGMTAFLPTAAAARAAGPGFLGRLGMTVGVYVLVGWGGVRREG